MRCFTISKRNKKSKRHGKPGGKPGQASSGKRPETPPRSKGDRGAKDDRPRGKADARPKDDRPRGGSPGQRPDRNPPDVADDFFDQAEQRDAARRHQSGPRELGDPEPLPPPDRRGGGDRRGNDDRRNTSDFDRWSRENKPRDDAGRRDQSDDYPRANARFQRGNDAKKGDDKKGGEGRKKSFKPERQREFDRQAQKSSGDRNDRGGSGNRNDRGGGNNRNDRGPSNRNDRDGGPNNRDNRPHKPGMLRGRGGNNLGPRHGNREREQGDDQPKSARADAVGGAWLAKARQETEKKVKAWLAEGAAMRAARASAPADSANTLDPWQQDVFDALVAGKSVIVDAPTTAGKTRAVEAFFRTFIDDPGFRACYTTPVKSLSNDKLREFREMFGSQNVGIATGDIKENLGAPIVVATLESYRNSLLGVEPDLGRTLCVFDEYHYVQDEGRGSAWEEALILTPPSCQVLLLSASVANAEEFTAWINTLSDNKRECVLVRTERRPVPLQPLVFYGDSWLLPETLPPNAMRNLDRQRLALPDRQEELAEKVKTLVGLELSPTIIYCGRRIACETMAALLMKKLPPLTAQESERIGASLESSHKEFHALSFITPRLRQMLQVYGVGFHHSGLAAPARMAIEQLVKHGYLRFCTATMGLSLGINFSVRSALISDFQRPGEGGFTDYGPSEVLQMLGRAGRRGKDVVGFSLWSTPEAMSRLGTARRDKVESRLRNDPTTFLGLTGRGFSLRAIENFYAKSFRRFQDRQVDLTVITKTRLAKKLDVDDLCCHSPAAEITRFWKEDRDSKCYGCVLRPQCHQFLEAKASGSLAALHLHLHSIGALDREEKLTDFGKIARYFPQAGGLMIARMISDGEVTPDTLNRTLELCAALTLARFKEPGVQGGYRLPYSPAEIDEKLESFYPFELFEEIYDPPFKNRDFPVIREFNPAAGFVIREWLNGMPWKDLTQAVTTEQYGTGDMMALLYRSATYLQSMIQADLKDLKPMARTLRELILREPLSYALSI